MRDPRGNARPAASRPGNGRGRLSPIGDNPQDINLTDCRFVSPRWRPAIPLSTTDLSCGSLVKDLTCRRYAADQVPRQTNQRFGAYTPCASSVRCVGGASHSPQS
jgi:hypothetical protein